MSKQELRYTSGKVEVRDGMGDELSMGKQWRYLSGYAARFTPVRSLDLGGWRERLDPHVFDESLASPNDIRMYHQHHVENGVIARRQNGTLRLQADGVGLRFDVRIDTSTILGRNVYEQVASGLCDEMSFGFVDKGSTWAKEKDERGFDVPVRTVKNCRLIEVSACAEGAYPHTSLSARSKEDAAAMVARLLPQGIPDSFPLEVRSLIAAGKYGMNTEDTIAFQQRMRARVIEYDSLFGNDSRKGDLWIAAQLRKAYAKHGDL